MLTYTYIIKRTIPQSFSRSKGIYNSMLRMSMMALSRQVMRMKLNKLENLGIGSMVVFKECQPELLKKIGR